jgi:adenine-specific DNA-methyltransferase
MSNEGDWVFDPFLGTGTSIIAAIKHNRRGMGAEVIEKYINIAKDRITKQLAGVLRTRPMHKPIYDPKTENNKLTINPWIKNKVDQQQIIFKQKDEV